MLCHVFCCTALVFKFKLAKATTLDSFHVFVKYVIVHTLPAGNFSTTESAGIFILREIK